MERPATYYSYPLPFRAVQDSPTTRVRCCAQFLLNYQLRLLEADEGRDHDNNCPKNMSRGYAQERKRPDTNGLSLGGDVPKNDPREDETSAKFRRGRHAETSSRLAGNTSHTHTHSSHVQHSTQNERGCRLDCAPRMRRTITNRSQPVVATAPTSCGRSRILGTSANILPS